MTEPDVDPTATRLVAARTALILDRPFLGALTLRLGLAPVDAPWCPQMHTDGTTLFYRAGWVETLEPGQVQFALAAQALHCALSHVTRRGRRSEQRWSRACRHVVHLALLDEGLEAPPGFSADPAFVGLTADEVYALLTEREPTGGNEGNPRREDAPADTAGHVDEPSGTTRDPVQEEAPMPRPMAAPGIDDTVRAAWQRRLAGAAQGALKAGRLSSGLARMVELALRPPLPWRALLAQHVNGLGREDFSYARPSSRRGDPAVFPSLRSTQLDLVVAVDVSGSIDADEFGEFMTEVDALKAQIRARVTLLTCDSALTGDSPWVYEPWDTCELPTTVPGSGATDFCPVFDWIEAQDRRPDLLVWFTDAAGRFPALEPDYPTLWLVKGGRAVPFGERIQLA